MLSFSLCTDVPGCKTDFFECRQRVGETDIKDFVEKIVGQLLAFSEKSFNEMRHTYCGVITSIDQAIIPVNVYNTSTNFKDTISVIKHMKKKKYHLVKAASVCWV